MPKRDRSNVRLKKGIRYAGGHREKSLSPHMMEIRDRFAPIVSRKTIPCRRCLKPRHPNELGKDGTCLAVLRCETEYLALRSTWRNDPATRQPSVKKGVAIPGSQAQTGGAAATGVATQEVQSMEATHQERVETARRMLERGAKVSAIVDRTGFGQATVYRMKADPSYAPSASGSARMQKAAVTKEAKRVQEPTSLRGAILAELRKPGNYPELDSEALTRRLSIQMGRGVGLHEVQHILASLVGQGLVKASARKNGRYKVYDHIELTDRGWSRTGGKPAKAAVESPPQPAGEAPSALEMPPLAPTPTPAEITAQQPSPPTTYPLISQILTRGTKVRAAARLLDEAGLHEAAELIRNEDKALSPLEAEIITLLEEHNIDI